MFEGKSESSSRRFVWLGLKLAVTAGAFAYLLTRQPIEELMAAVRALSVQALLLAVGLHLFALLVGAVRWGALMRAYGARTLPRLSELYRAYVIGFFYNTYVPGAVGGDVLRGIVTRKAFGEQGATSAIAVVVIERALGLGGLLVLTASAALIFVSERSGNIVPYSVLGLCAVMLGIIVLSLGRRYAHLAPASVEKLLRSLPELTGKRELAFAALLSLVTHAIIALIGHELLASIHADARLLDSFVAMPLAAAAAYFPATVAGMGARDAALVELYGAFGVPRPAALAMAFAFLFSTLAAAGLGGLLQLLRPMSPDQPAAEGGERPAL